MTDLTGKCAFVTGSVQGIGLAIAEAMAQAGARIALHGLASAEEAAEICTNLERLGAPEARFFPADLRDADVIAAACAAAEAWGPVDILVNNAGIQRTASLEALRRETWDEILAVNLSGAFHAMHALLPPMGRRGYGRVINIASVHGLVASKEKAPYVASKFGLVGLSKVAALEYADAGSRASGGVTVNCIAPGWTETAIIEPQVAARAEAFGGDRDKGIADLLGEKQPSRRVSDPAEIAALALFLCAKQGHNITGTVIPVDGGWTAQ